MGSSVPSLRRRRTILACSLRTSAVAFWRQVAVIRGRRRPSVASVGRAGAALSVTEPTEPTEPPRRSPVTYVASRTQPETDDVIKASQPV